MLGQWRNKKHARNNATTDNAEESVTKKSFCSRDLFLPRGLLLIDLFISLFSFKLLFSDIQELQDDIPSTCKFRVPNPNELSKLELLITPSKDSMWYGGKFKFIIDVPIEYKYVVC